MSHTPGPWYPVCHQYDDDETIWSYVVYAGKGTAIADLVMFTDEEGERSRENLDANARLICAAPDLLAALIRLREMDQAFAAQVVERAGETVMDVALLGALGMAWDDADAAITKATAHGQAVST